MRTLFTTVMLLCAMTVLCQPDSESKKGFKVGMTFSPDIYFDSKSFSLTKETGFGSVDASGLNFTSGLVGEWSFKSGFDIVFGINYSRKDLSGRYYCNVCEFVTLPAIEPLKVRFMEIPVFVRYNLLDKRFGIHIEAGMNNGYLLNSISSTYTGDLTANKYQVGGLMGVGIDLDLWKKINFYLTSKLSQSFTNLLVGSDLKYHSVGFVTGITYKIN